jgi:hypothetical protein
MAGSQVLKNSPGENQGSPQPCVAGSESLSIVLFSFLMGRPSDLEIVVHSLELPFRSDL